MLEHQLATNARVAFWALSAAAACLAAAMPVLMAGAAARGWMLESLTRFRIEAEPTAWTSARVASRRARRRCARPPGWPADIERR